MNLCAFVHFTLLFVLAEHAEKGRYDRFITNAHKAREIFTEMVGGFFQMIVGDFCEHVVHLVCANTMNDVVNKAVISVNC